MFIYPKDVSILRDAFFEYARPNADGVLELDSEVPFGSKYFELDILDIIDFNTNDRGYCIEDAKVYARKCFDYMIKEMALEDDSVNQRPSFA